jgi:hypothetical protein
LVDKGGITAPGYHKFVNLQRLFIYAVKYPFLRGIIRKIINYRNNFIFESLFLLSHFWNYVFFEEIRLRDIVRLESKNFKAFFK